MNVVLTDIIDKMTEQEFQDFLEACEDAGMCEREDFSSKSDLKSELFKERKFSKNDKEAILANLKKGKGPFDTDWRG